MLFSVVWAMVGAAKDATESAALVPKNVLRLLLVGLPFLFFALQLIQSRRPIFHVPGVCDAIAAQFLNVNGHD